MDKVEMLIDRLNTLQDHYSTSGNLGADNSRIFADAAAMIDALKKDRRVIQDLINAWDYCNQNPADRGYAVLSDAIEEARTAVTNGERT